jgi:hypothetical protein
LDDFANGRIPLKKLGGFGTEYPFVEEAGQIAL